MTARIRDYLRRNQDDGPRLVVDLDECITCAGMSNIGKRICQFEVGFVAGVGSAVRHGAVAGAGVRLESGCENCRARTGARRARDWRRCGSALPPSGARSPPRSSGDNPSACPSRPCVLLTRRRFPLR